MEKPIAGGYAPVNGLELYWESYGQGGTPLIVVQRRPYDWSDEVRGLTTETMLVFADADSVPASHIAEFYALLGGGLRDAGWDGSARSHARLAVLPGLTHYDIFGAPQLIDVIDPFLR
jgi:pimeloyl-ACP methyl ester carboxylesterase